PNLNRHAWRTKEIVFIETPIGEALEIVGRAYDIQLIAEKADLDRCEFTFNTTFKDDTLEEVIEVFERLTGGQIQRDDQSNVFRLTNWCAPN
ncbi:MAG: DUF4974 domain-containing protein, partial [Bacteroidota bacterium]